MGELGEYERLFDDVDAPDDLVESARKRGWADGSVERLLRLRARRENIEAWLGPEGPSSENVTSWLADRERLTLGTLRCRPVIRNSDGDGLAALWDEAPETIGEWEVTVQRSPNAFAQFDIQERAQVVVIEDRGVLLSCLATSVRDVLVEGKRLTCLALGAARTHRGARGMGLSRLLQNNWGGVVGKTLAPGRYWYIRSQNFAAAKWMEAVHEGVFRNEQPRDDEVPGLPVVVTELTAIPYDGDDTGIRLGRVGDARTCAAMINRTHKGLDLFLPYTAERLKDRLNQWCWGERPPWWNSTYGWDDFYVLELDGRLVACAGLWDRGRDVREVWHHPASGTTRVNSVTNLLDFGFAEGHEAEMVRLIRFLLGRTHALGRDALAAPLQTLPEVRDKLSDGGWTEDTRGLLWTMVSPEGGFYPTPPVSPKRPFTDLAYW
jgi:hypothetical protein